MNKNIILASASPRRQELLGLITESFTVVPSDAEEIIPEGTPTDKTAECLAIIKARAVAENYPDSIVIGADTCVVSQGVILGKPRDRQEAYRMLKMLSGKTHSVFTGCAIAEGKSIKSFSVETKVEFYALSEKEIENYIDTSEPYDKAGAYGIQGKASLFVKGIVGDYFNVVGLPVAELNRNLLDKFPFGE